MNNKTTRAILIVNLPASLKGGGGVFLSNLTSTLQMYGYRCEIIDKTYVRDLLLKGSEYDLIIVYSNSKLNKLLKIFALAQKLNKPVLWILGLAAFIRRPSIPELLFYNAGKLLEFFLIKIIFKHNLVVAVHNKDDYNLLRKFLGQRVVLFPPAIDTNLFKPCEKNKQFTIVVSAAPATWMKGIDVVLRILPQIALKLSNEKIFVLTGGDGIEYFRNKLKIYQKKFKNITVFDRYLTREEIADILCRSHLLVFPSKAESFGILMGEALSCGTPVIAFDIPGSPRDLITNTLVGLRIKPYNTEELINAVLHYYKLWKQKPSLYARIVRECRKRAELYDVNYIGKYWIKLIELLHQKFIDIKTLKSVYKYG